MRVEPAVQQCVGAWEEQSDDCQVKYDMTCDQTIDSSDAICQCSEQESGSGQSPDTAPCDEILWPDKDHDLICGECKVLVDNFAGHYRTC